jgi:LmbE family N-acetylglucosaminyl deacetylase
MKKLLILLFLFLTTVFLKSSAEEPVKVLIVTAHPDDETTFAATVYKITHELNGVVDLAVITNGEAGYKYSTLAEPYYHIHLTDEATGRKYLPTIRKKELMAAGAIIGIRNYYFFDQQDNHYTLDPDTVLSQIWDVPSIKTRLKNIIINGKYGFIFCLLPTEDTHGHHKGATIIALQTVNEMKSPKPVVLGASGSSKTDSTEKEFNMLDKYPVTKISAGHSTWKTDKTVSFGFKNQLNYKIIVNWEIAEHKSQGSMQNYMSKGDYENFWWFDINNPDEKITVNTLFRQLQESMPKLEN